MLAHTGDPTQTEVEGHLEFSRSVWKQIISQNKNIVGQKPKYLLFMKMDIINAPLANRNN